MSVLDWLLMPQAPGATVFILLLSMLFTFLTSLANRTLTDQKQLNAWRKEVSDWNTKLKEARKTNDKRLMAKVMKRQPQIMKIQSKMMWQSMKVSFIFMIPFFIIWRVLFDTYGGHPIAYFPGVGTNLPLPLFGQSLFWWYMLCSMSFGMIFSRLLGVGMGAPK
ncbi:MAG: EMC3/TMCO1 family protein [Thermoproteota archaeon]|nr:EMC3/TMCO1 family protein [Thermoproteota archaeon]